MKDLKGPLMSVAGGTGITVSRPGGVRDIEVRAP